MWQLNIPTAYRLRRWIARKCEAITVRSRTAATRAKLRFLSSLPALPRTGDALIPEVHPSVRDFFSITSTKRCRFRFYPVNLDVKQTEVLRTLLVDENRATLTDDADLESIPIYNSVDPEVEKLFCTAPPSTAVFLDLHDRGRDGLDLTRAMWSVIARRRIKVFYLKLQIHDVNYYSTANLLPRFVQVLSMPLLLGGSRFHITTQKDYQGDSLFRNVFKSNDASNFAYDWSWIGGGTSKDRVAAFSVLDSLRTDRSFCRISTPGHPDASLASVAYPEYIAISRNSKVCISLNGNGPWCLKDGEMFASHCFVLRQRHPVLFLNPLTPRSGVHWAIANTHELPKAIEYYLCNHAERERIRQEGHAYFRQVLFEGRWAATYIQAIEQFLKTGAKQTLGKLLVA
jgi:hypothetical protein